MNPETILIILTPLFFAALVLLFLAVGAHGRQITQLKAKLRNTRTNMNWIEDQLIDHVFDHADDESEQIAKDYEI